MKTLLKLFIIMGVVLAASCKHKKSNTELFNETYQRNVDACVAEMLRNGADSAYAVQKCACMIRVAFELDSTMLSMKGKVLSDFLKGNIAEMEEICDSLIANSADTNSFIKKENNFSY